jgi:hypothetical protein
MTIPGQNLLNLAMTLLGRQSFQYYAYAARTPNAIGQDVTTYAAPVTLSGSVQPVPRTLYESFGLDFDRYYLTFYVAANVLDVARDISGDQMFFNGNTYQCVQKTDWFPQDGWTSILCVQVPNYINPYLSFITSDMQSFLTSTGDNFLVPG